MPSGVGRGGGLRNMLRWPWVTQARHAALSRPADVTWGGGGGGAGVSGPHAVSFSGSI